jgi:adenylate cyclase
MTAIVRTRVAQRALVGLLALGVLGLLAAVGVLHRLELLSRDWRIASGVGRQAPGNDIVIAWLDQESMDYLRAQGVTWPYARSFWGEAVDYVRKGGARAVVLDVLFTEPGTSADDDRDAGQLLAASDSDVLAMKLVDWRDGGFDADETQRLEQRGRTLEDLGGLPSARGAALPIPELEKGADELGFVEVRADADKVHRRYDLVRVCRGKVYPSLALATAMLATGSKGLRLDAGRLHFGDRSVPVGGDGAMSLAFRGPPLSFPHVQVVNIVQSINLIADGKPALYPAERFQD